MSSLFKRIRHYYWLFTSFIKKNVRFLLISFVSGFLIILAIINFFPFFNSIFFQNKETIGIIGNYSTKNLPGEVTSLISSPLITINQDGEIQPILANSWENLNEGKTYRFHLKTDLYWTDGKRFNANNIEYEFQDVEVVAVDDYTIDFNLTQPLSIFPIYLTRPVIKHPLIGVGPLYDVEGYKSNGELLESIQLSPNKPDLPFKIFKFYRSEDDLITGYKKGDITSFVTPNRTIAELFADWNNSEIKRDVDYSQVLTLFINTEKGPLQERDVRKGIAFATPQFNEFGIPAKSPIPPTSWAFSDDVKEYPLNLERAASLLDKNIEASDSANFTLYTFFDYIDVAEELKKSYEEAGLLVNLKIVSVVPEEYDLLLTAWNPPADPDQYFFWHSTQEGTNITKFNDAKTDKLLEDGRRIVNVKQRQKIYADFQKNLVEEVPAHFIYHPYIYTVRRK